MEENVIDPGIDWTNHENSTDRSRIGAPTTHTLADKGLNTTISHSDLTSGAAAKLGMSSKARQTGVAAESWMSVPRPVQVAHVTW